MRTCNREGCIHGGLPQEDTNFYKTKFYECKDCSRLRSFKTHARAVEKRRNSTDPVDHEQAPRLKVEGIRVWLRAQIELHGGAQNGNRIFCEHVKASGVFPNADRTVYRWLYETDMVDFDTFDRFVCAYGQPWVLRELFPHLWDDLPPYEDDEDDREYEGSMAA